MRTYQIPEDVLQTLLVYLGAQPYREVHGLVAALLEAKPLQTATLGEERQ